MKNRYLASFFYSLLICFYLAISFLFFVRIKYIIINNTIYLLIFLALNFLPIFLILQFAFKTHIHNNLEILYNNFIKHSRIKVDKDSFIYDFETALRIIKTYATSMNQQIRKLNKRDGYRKQFLGNISHELKTPLFTVQGYLLTLKEGAINDLEVRDKYIERAQKGIERLTLIVQDLDIITKFEQKAFKLHLSSFNILTLIKQVIELLEVDALSKSINVELTNITVFPIKALADKERIEQVLINLLSNAIKYGKEKGYVKFTVSQKGKKVVVEIKDNGLGISKSDQHRVFERFFRSDKNRLRDSHTEGSGLGLAITKHILRYHNQRISLKSKVNKGSIFTFTLDKSNT